MIQFHETVYGRRFFDGQLPALIKNLGRIADAMEAGREAVGETMNNKFDVLKRIAGGGELDEMTESLEKAVEELDEADYWMGTWLFTQGGSEGRWERRYFKADSRQQVEDWLWGHDTGGEAVGVYVELVDFEIDTDWDIEDLTKEGR